MDQGEIIESGTHSNLLESSGLYAKLLKNQVNNS